MDPQESEDIPDGGVQGLPAAPETVIRLESSAGAPVAAWLCTPDRLEALAAGWLFCEGIVASMEDLSDLNVASPHVVRVELSEFATQRLADRRRAAGPGPAPAQIRAGVKAGRYRPQPTLENLLSDPTRLARLFRDLFDGASARTTGGGGLHTGALVVAGSIVDVVEDVSRSAVIDKLVGSTLLAGGVPEQSLLLLSGRISGSIAVKLAAAGIAAAATISIPTTLAVEISGRAGVALVGRARRDTPYRYGNA
jgi:FdhD protein